MKIAVASEGKIVAQHFGHCEGFTIFEAQEGRITGKEYFVNPGHRPGFLPVFLHEKGANVVISGGMGGGAIEIFNEKGIDVITGATGDIEETVKQFLQGQLISSGSVCHEHQHADECGH
jgi:predicted Fe-Mo cluster-binding NifX family protein